MQLLSKSYFIQNIWFGFGNTNLEVTNNSAIIDLSFFNITNKQIQYFGFVLSKFKNLISLVLYLRNNKLSN